MDALRPGHAHRSSSDRLLNNYLDSQKSLTTSLLTLISHSHSSTSSLLAYVTSSPGVIVPIRRAVRHAAFEGPLSPELMNDPHGGFDGDHGQGGWASYISSLDQFRKDLKQIHLLEEELSRVKRDREILVTRLIKTTKSRPTRSDLSALATSYSTHNGPAQSSRNSVLSLSSNGSGTVSTKEGKRAGKLADAQAELLGCEEHLRSLEVRIENERNKVMMRGLEERFRAMDVVGRMWVQQSKKGLHDLERLQDLPPDAFELDSNGSLAPSQSASQIAYEDSSHRGHPFPRGFGHENGPGSITGSIQEEDEDGSSADEAQGGGTLVVHENRPESRASALQNRGGRNTPKPSPLGVPSINTQARPLSSTIGGSRGNLHGDDSDDEPVNFRSGGRRAASDVGGMAYRPPTGRQPLRRTFSDDRHNNSAPVRRANSDSSSIRSQRKKKGFFASLGRLFKGSSSKKSRSGRESPSYGSSSHNRRSSGGGGWHTRTDSNIKRGGTLSRRGGGGDDSSSDEDTGNFVSVTNNRNSTWSVDNQRDAKGGIKRSSTMPVASGLIPSKPAAKSDLGMKRNSSQSTITGNRPRSVTPLPASTKGNLNQGSLSRSNTVKSSMSTASAKSAGTVKSTGTAKKKTRANGSIARASITAQQAAEGRNIMQLVDGATNTTPKMPDVPKAPKSQVTPQMELPKAPGSSLVHPEPLKSQAAHTNSEIPTLGRSISRSNSVKKVANHDSAPVASVPKKEKETSPKRSTTPLPPSRMLSPPLKSALRPSSPLPPSPPLVPQEPPKPMFTITAPGPVQLPAEPAPEPVEEKFVPPPNNKRNSYHSMTSDGASIYESANEGDGSDEDGQGSSADEDDDMGYKVVENEKVRRAGEIATGVGRYEEDVDGDGDGDDTASDHTVEAGPTATSTNTNTKAPPPQAISVPPPASAVGSETASGVARRKSVRMAVPDSPVVEKAPPAITSGGHTTDNAYRPPTSDYGHNGHGDTNNNNHQDEARPTSPEPERIKEDWSTRIGRMREDTSDEDDIDPDYRRARKGLSKVDKKWDALTAEEKERQAQAQAKDGKLKKRGSVKSNKSNKSRSSRI
ncbi:uncharacterized protein I303_107419 [Kwoniella dejecticola CBS 10117]|uniref:Uncharacterized protein n=1 Tax=Kwoniella dejecticola CBS 10117 TaxID=1296121 RepID=A0A1A5ZZM0_9TREE|nr:uncharacterized protein I303_06823 [Kwoniella dejecticola CBS 10117]OBR83260.1 hypothetical protein I303_06823 [Kwoniella dejecticola CBS 10117]